MLFLHCATAYSQNTPNLRNPELISAGQRLFHEKHCTYCHGNEVDGPIKLAGRDDLMPEEVFQTISEGKVQGNLRMPAWRGVLTDEQIWQATAYVMSLSEQSK